MSDYKRILRVSVHPTILGPMIMKSNSEVICLNPLPEDAQFCGWAHDPSRNSISLFYEHPSFQETHYTCEVPEYRLEFEKIPK